MKRIFVAPVQGHTDAVWRHFHHKLYGGNLKYFTPFIRCEHEGVRIKDHRDFVNPLNEGVDLEPQVIFRNTEELEILLSYLVENGAHTVNLNMGCPFPPQTGKGRGAGFIANHSEAAKIAALMEKFPELKFSVKMRLGNEDPDEWKGIIGILNSVKLDNLYVHPRIGRQQYGGELYLDNFVEILERSTNPVVFNGDIKTPLDIKNVTESIPGLNGVMSARGILRRPSLAAEYAEGEWPKQKRVKQMVRFHDELLGYYKNTLCGDSQILSKIRSFWEYAEAEIGRKAWKALKKATRLPQYESVVESLIHEA